MLCALQLALPALPVARQTSVRAVQRFAAPRRTCLTRGAAAGSSGSAFLAGSAAQQALAPRPAAPCRRCRSIGPVRVQALGVWAAVWGAALAGLLAGLLLAKWSQAFFARQFDHSKTTRENAELRAKVEELQQMVTKFEPMAYKSMRLRFTKGVNKAVILGLVDELLANKEVNIWWLPDSLERLLYFNVISLMLSVLDEVVEGMSVNFAGHNVKLQLTYLDLGAEQYPSSAGSQASGGDSSGSSECSVDVVGGNGRLLPAA